VKTWIASLLFLISIAPLSAQPAGDGEIVAETPPYVLPAFQDLPSSLQREVTRQERPETYEEVRRDARFSLRKLKYRSDGLQVVAYLYAPASPGVERRPAIVFNRGSWVASDQAPVLAPLFHRLASAGFVVLAPQYRGSDGGEGRDEMGGADVADVMNAVRLIRSLPFVDGENVFLYGSSRGGMMTYQAIRDGVEVRAAATVGAFTDLEATMAGDSRSRDAAPQIWPDLASRRAEIAERRSALRWADRLTVPLLILHGGNDRQISPRQSLDLALRLQELGRPYELHVVAGEGHTLDGRVEERERMVVEWFRRHMQSPQGPASGSASGSER
jgi:dipeptidyl aminopeptidase/acylaminoacyl peptidase